jgi:hypothetical protein
VKFLKHNPLSLFDESIDDLQIQFCMHLHRSRQHMDGRVDRTNKYIVEYVKQTVEDDPEDKRDSYIECAEPVQCSF